MFKLGLVITMIFFTVSCFNKKPVKKKSNTTDAAKAELSTNNSSNSLKEKMTSEEVNYDSVVAEIENLKSEKRRLVVENKTIKKAMASASDKILRIKYAANKSDLSKIEDQIEEKRLVARIAKQKENIALFEYRVSLLDKSNPNYDRFKQSFDNALVVAKDRISAYENEKENLEKLSQLRKKSVEVLSETGDVDRGVETDIKAVEAELKAAKKARTKKLAEESTALSRGLKQAKEQLDKDLVQAKQDLKVMGDDFRQAKKEIGEKIDQTKKNVGENVAEAKKELGENIKKAEAKAKEMKANGVKLITKYKGVAETFVQESLDNIAKAIKGDKPNVYGLTTLKDLTLDDKDAAIRIEKEMDRLLLVLKKLDAELPKIKMAKMSYLNKLEDAGKELFELHNKIKKEESSKLVGYVGRVEVIKKEIEGVNQSVSEINSIFSHLDKYADKVELGKEANFGLYKRLMDVERYFWVKDAVNARIKKLTEEFGESSPTKQDTEALKKYIKTIQNMLAEYKVRLKNGGPHIGFGNQLLHFASTREPASIKKAK